MGYSYNAPPPPPRQRSPWFYVLWGCGGCACLTVIGIAIAVFMLGKGFQHAIEDIAAMQRQAKVDLKVQDHKMVTEEEKHYIVGSIKNNSATHTYETVMIEFSLSDKQGKSLPSVTARVQDLKPGATSEFKAPVTSATAATYKYQDVSGFVDMSEEPNLDPATRSRMKAQKEEMHRRFEDMFDKAQKSSGEQSNP